MKIAVVTHVFPADSVEPKDATGIFIPDTVEALARRGHEMFVFAPDVAESKRARDAFEVIWFPWTRSDRPLGLLKPTRPLDLLRLISFYRNGARHLIKLHQRVGLDACLAYWAIPAGHFCCKLKQASGVPYLAWCLGSDIHTFGKKPILRTLLQKALASADALAADGFDIAEEVQRIAGRPCEFLPVVQERFKTTAPPQDWPPELFHLLCVGRQTPIKGQTELIEALRLLPDETRRRLRVHFCGSGPSLAHNQALAETYGLASMVQFHGFVPDPQLGSFWRSANAAVIPSHNESIPQILIEAMQHRLPLVVTDVGDMGTIVRRHEIGIVVPDGDAQALADALARLLSYDAAPGYARTDTAEFLRQYSLPHVADRLAALLAEMAQAHARR